MNTNDSTDLSWDSSRLLAEIAARRLSHAAFAKLVGVHSNTMSAWTSGRASPKVEMLVKMAGLLECRVIDLLPREGDR